MNTNTEQLEAFDIPTFCMTYSVGRSTCYKEMNARRLPFKKVGKRVLIPADGARAWFEALPNNRTKVHEATYPNGHCKS
jgi:hypothetical protein